MSKTKWIFALATILTILINLYLLKSFFGFGFVNEDWQYIVAYKIVNLNPFLKYFYFWREVGPRGAYYISYLGTLDSIFPNNYQLIQILNFTLKTLACIALFPLIYIITKDKVLSFFSTLFLSISYASAGLLTYASTGIEYLGLIFLYFFVGTYFLFYKSRKTKYYLFSFLFLYGSLATSYLRSFPALLFIPIFEILIITKKKDSIKNSIMRSFLIFTPLLLIVFVISFRINTASTGSLYDLSGITNVMLPNNWYRFINPLAGIGFQFVSAENLKLFGKWDMLSLKSFLRFLFPKFFILFSAISVLAINAFTPHFKKYFLILGTAESVFVSILFILITKAGIALPSQEFAFFAGLIGSFILSISITAGIIWWQKNKKNYLLFLIFVSPLISFFFIFATWMFIGIHFTYEDGIHRYLAFPAVGTSVFLAAIVTLSLRNKNKLKFMNYFFAIILIIFCFSISQKELGFYFSNLKDLGVELPSQQAIQKDFYNQFIKNKQNLLIYFESNKNPDKNTLYWQRALEIDHSPYWTYLQNYYLNKNLDSCIAIAPNFEKLSKSVKKSKGTLEFNIEVQCSDELNKNLAGNYKGISTRNFKQDQFFAFTLEGNKVIDITKKVLEKVGN